MYPKIPTSLTAGRDFFVASNSNIKRFETLLHNNIITFFLTNLT